MQVAKLPSAAMRFDVLGSDGTYPGPGSATAGFLVQTAGTNLWIDAGVGTLARLTERVSLHDVSAILVSHRHIDHCADLAAWHHAARFGAEPVAPVDLYAAQGVLDAIVGLNASSADSFVHHEVTMGDEAPIGDVAVSFGPTNHSAEAVSMRLESGESSLVYTGDTGWDDRLVDFARSADLLVSEATLVGQARGANGHQSPSEAGRLAQLAGAKQLVLVHIPPHLDRRQAEREAATTFSGTIVAGHAGLTIDLGAP